MTKTNIFLEKKQRKNTCNYSLKIITMFEDDFFNKSIKIKTIKNQRSIRRFGNNCFKNSEIHSIKLS
jgi:DNA-binding protein